MRLLVAMLKAAAVFAAVIGLVCFVGFMFETFGPHAFGVLLVLAVFVLLTFLFYMES